MGRWLTPYGVHGSVSTSAGMAVSYRTSITKCILVLSIITSALEGYSLVEETLGVLPILSRKWGKDFCISRA